MEKPAPLYYRTRVMDLDAPDIVGMCDDLVSVAGYRAKEGYDLQLWKWLQWFFQENRPVTLKASLFPPHSALVVRISKLSGTPLHTFCAELARERHTHLEGHENATLLTFLKGIYRGDQINK
jgi:hypothetical protein